jgi:Ion channel
MFEGPARPLLSRHQFAVRMGAFTLAAIAVDGLALAVGAIGYHYLEGVDWLDAGLDAALVMTGNGPIHHPQTPAGKLFTILDALLGVILFAAVIGVLLIPVLHRMLHAFHRRHEGDSEHDEQRLRVSSQDQLDSNASAG